MEAPNKTKKLWLEVSKITGEALSESGNRDKGYAETAKNSRKLGEHKEREKLF